ncbi:unnamed protein product [Rotaria sp. Silwood2]|nr:unnamed protein product [Rotaria sp. Silwood2]CAF4123599.1 unnamed protein product [Rotaria sp. Silwood2]
MIPDDALIGQITTYSNMTDESRFTIDDSRDSMNHILAQVSLSPIRSQTRKRLDQHSYSGLRRLTAKFISAVQVIQKYEPDSSQATCIIRNQQYSVHYRGKADIENHIRTKKHQHHMKSYDVNQRLITKKIMISKEKDEVAAAEGVLVYHGVKHGHSYLAQQCTTNVCKAIFSSSSIANNLACARTKSTFIARNVLAPFFTYTLLDDLKQSFYYSVMYDANNKGNIKVFPFCVPFLSITGLVDLMHDAKEPVFKIFANARKVITDNDSDINGLKPLGSDNTNVNAGEKHSVFTLFSDELPCTIKGEDIII